MYVEKLIEKLGLAQALTQKTTRHRDAQEAFTHLLRGKGREIGFGGVTEIGRWRNKGLMLVAPLPAEIRISRRTSRHSPQRPPMRKEQGPFSVS